MKRKFLNKTHYKIMEVFIPISDEVAPANGEVNGERLDGDLVQDCQSKQEDSKAKDVLGE